MCKPLIGWNSINWL